ncbi:hypothetical protein [Granulicella sp. L60]|jgi:hypothetical protein|uniref:hypothetical protein n=1 Tax=Granulicella sp. L60 TaxID=1641866 RepID=UPI00131BFE57|nr:hypothetical protein [Granulicella sp. L60]
MANDIVRSGKKELAGRGEAIEKAGSAPKKHAKKAAKHVAKKHVAKHAAKKHVAKAAKHVGKKQSGVGSIRADQLGLMTAFHHMQRASAVISLMEKGTGEDLRDLLGRGVKLYRKASDGDEGERFILRAIGVLKAAEHLAMGGLYEARAKHRQKVSEPGQERLARLVAEVGGRLEAVKDGERGKGKDLFPVTEELLRQAEDIDDDIHLAFELAMAADALCFALESGL